MNYSESMSKRQQRRKALNQRFRRMFLVALLMGLAMGFVFGRCSAVNSKAPDAPIEPDQLTAVTPDVTLEPVEIPLVEEPAEPEPVLLGSFRVTAYCSCEKCCGEWAKNRPNGIVYGAAGVELKAGVSCASPLPLGTVVEVEGLGEYIVQDRPAQWVIDKYGENQLDMLAPVENLMGVATDARISTLVLIPVRKTRTPVVRPPSMKKRPFRSSRTHSLPP